mgnify:CR=1 FL=1
MSIIVIHSEEDRKRAAELQKYLDFLQRVTSVLSGDPAVVVESTCPTCGQKRYTDPAAMAKGDPTP